MPHDRRVVKTNFDPFTNDFHDDRRNRHDRYNPTFESRFSPVSPPRKARSKRRLNREDIAEFIVI
jgi:hypothetical protein